MFKHVKYVYCVILFFIKDYNLKEYIRFIYSSDVTIQTGMP